MLLYVYFGEVKMGVDYRDYEELEEKARREVIKVKKKPKKPKKTWCQTQQCKDTGKKTSYSMSKSGTVLKRVKDRNEKRQPYQIKKIDQEH